MRKADSNTELFAETLRAARDRMLVVAHRGCSGRAPENTRAAFEMAIKLGADMIECDVRLTKDEEVVAFHDRTLKRTTNGIGPVGERTLDELKSLDVGSWFEGCFAGERIPTLCEVLQLLDGCALLIIELKANRGNRRATGILKDRVLQAVASHHAEDQVILASFDHRLMREIKERNPRLKTAIIYKAVRDFASLPSHLVSRVRADAFVCGRWWLSKRLLGDLRNHRIPLFVYTIDAPRDVEKMLRLKVDGVITNFPDVVLEVLKGRSSSLDFSDTL